MVEYQRSNLHQPEITENPYIPEGIPDIEFYCPHFSPWRGYGEFKELFNMALPSTLVTAKDCFNLYSLAEQALHFKGEFWECGVYKGGTAIFLSELIIRKSGSSTPKLRLFDTFEGMPAPNPQRDWHQKGDFSDTSLEAVKKNQIQQRCIS